MTSEFGLIARAKRDHLAREALDLPEHWRRDEECPNPAAAAVETRRRWREFIAEAPERAFPDDPRR